jgi:hypothetical protein
MNTTKKITFKLNEGVNLGKAQTSLVRGNIILSENYSGNAEKDSVGSIQIFVPIVGKEQSSIQNIYRFLEKLFNSEQRLVTLPEWFYYAIKEKHFSVSLSKSVNDITINLKPGSKFEETLVNLVQSLKEHPIKDIIAKDKSSIEFSLSVNEGLSDRIKTYCENADKTDLSTVLLDRISANINLLMDEKASDAVEKILASLFPDLSLDYLSLFDSCELELDLRFLNEGEELSLWDNKSLERTIQGYLRYLLSCFINYFRALNEEQLKNWAKMLNFLKSETDLIEFLYVEVTLKDVGWLEIEISVKGAIELIELLVFHPLQNQTEKVKLFKTKFLQRYNQK